MDLAELAEALKSGSITVPEWEAGMRDYLRTQYRVAVELVKGGSENVTPADWGYEGSLLKKQYQFLSDFAAEISKNPEAWNNSRLDARMNLYKESAYSALSDLQAREMEDQDFTEERNILESGNSCDECISETARGWVEIGTLIPVGQRTCIVNCKCEIEYRKQLPDGSYVYG